MPSTEAINALGMRQYQVNDVDALRRAVEFAQIFVTGLGGTFARIPLAS
jgi:hypothetical protein